MESPSDLTSSAWLRPVLRRDCWSARPGLLACLLLSLSALAAYANSLRGPFVYDDGPAIVDNESLRHLGTIFFPPHGGITVEGRPILNASFALNYALGGAHPWGYHALNLVIHALAGLALLGVARRALASRVQRAQEAAFALALLWTVDPLQTESVTYVAQRAESLMGLFYLLTLYCFIRGAEAQQRPGAENPRLWYGLSLLACFLGMGTKEAMVTAPVLVFFYDGIFLAGSLAEAWRRRRPVHLSLMATWFFLLVLVASTGADRGGTAGFGIAVNWGDYLLSQFPAVLHYLRLALWPHPLVFDYGPLAVSPVAAGAAALFVGALGLAAAAALKRQPALGFLGLWFFGILAPTSLVPSAVQSQAEHRMYLPLAAALALGVAVLFSKMRARSSLAISLALAAVFLVLTVRRNATYGSAIALWGDTVAKRPDNALARDNLGTAYFAQGRYPEALEQFAESVRLNPRSVYARLNLGNSLGLAGRLPEAIAQAEAAEELEPGWAGVQCELGDILSHAGRLKDARAHFEKALRIKPDYAQADNGLGSVLFRQSDSLGALALFQKALQLDPNYSEAYNNLGTALASSGRLPEAINAWARSVRLKPDYPEAHCNLGNALVQAGRPADAIGEYETALKQQGDSAEVRNQLAIAYAAIGRAQDAEAQFQQALRLAPGDPMTLRNLDRLHALEQQAGMTP